jgi:sterol desaturase/sphingolipid hydroxylase (fatty acid hydroxylase superfamily)
MASDAEPSKPSATAELDIVGHLTSCAAASRSVLMALACMYLLTDDYPAFGRAAGGWDLAWMLPILVRNVCAAWIICGSWDWFLYFSPLKEKLHPYKLNPRYPPLSQIKHDAFYTTVACFTAAAIEIPLCRAYAEGWLRAGAPLDPSFAAFRAEVAASPLFYAFWILCLTHWRVPHFYCIHRAMHPWKREGIPDIGKWLYKHVHSLHHKSYNPTAFSGTNMHPVESYLYFSAALMAVPFGCHPAIPLACIVDCAVGAWLGHDGFQWPGSGDYFHQLHHAHFDCNYGAMHVPMDKWMGTFAGSKDAVKEMWRKTKAK